MCSPFEVFAAERESTRSSDRRRRDAPITIYRIVYFSHRGEPVRNDDFEICISSSLNLAMMRENGVSRARARASVASRPRNRVFVEGRPIEVTAVETPYACIRQSCIIQRNSSNLLHRSREYKRIIALNQTVCRSVGSSGEIALLSEFSVRHDCYIFQRDAVICIPPLSFRPSLRCGARRRTSHVYISRLIKINS